MLDLAPASAVSRLIQLAIAPVFLLAGIGSILNVVTNRLARVVDRARKLEADFPSLADDQRAGARWELRRLGRRMRLVNGAIAACTASALFVCLVVAVLFVSDLVHLQTGRIVAVLFILAMALMILALVLFLAEVRMAARTLTIRTDLLDAPEPRE